MQKLQNAGSKKIEQSTMGNKKETRAYVAYQISSELFLPLVYVWPTNYYQKQIIVWEYTWNQVKIPGYLYDYAYPLIIISLNHMTMSVIPEYNCHSLPQVTFSHFLFSRPRVVLSLLRCWGELEALTHVVFFSSMLVALAPPCDLFSKNNNANNNPTQS